MKAVEEFLAELRSREQTQNVVLVSEITAVKFLMARKFDVSRAIELFQAYKVIILQMQPRAFVCSEHVAWFVLQHHLVCCYVFVYVCVCLSLRIQE